MVITAITFFVIKQHVHTYTEGINNRNKNVLFKTTFLTPYSLFSSFSPPVLTWLTWVLLRRWCAALWSKSNAPSPAVSGRSLSLDTGLYWKSYSPLQRECQFQDKVKMAVAPNPYLIVANGANTIEENQYCFHVWSYITFLWTTAYLRSFCLHGRDRGSPTMSRKQTHNSSSSSLWFTDKEPRIVANIYQRWLWKHDLNLSAWQQEGKRKKLFCLRAFDAAHQSGMLLPQQSRSVVMMLQRACADLFQR